MISPRDIEIGRRLRAFRESLKIPRTQFALAIGIGGERLASYESGRARIRYETVKAISREFCLSPLWLATGRDLMRHDQPFDDSEVAGKISPKAPFVQEFDEVLEAYFKDAGREASARASRFIEAMENFRSRDNPFWKLAAEKKLPKEMVDSIGELLRRSLQSVDEINALGDETKRVNAALAAKRNKARPKGD